MYFKVWSRQCVMLLIVPFMALLLPGCGANRILGADFNLFNANTTDSGFSGAIPGLPDGDTIEGPPHALNGSLSIAVNGPAGDGNNLRIVDISPPGLPQPALVSFVVEDHQLPHQYRIVWKGLTEWNGPPEEFRQHTEVHFMDETGTQALVLTFLDQAGSTQALLFSSGTEGVEAIDVNSSSPHEVLVTIHPQEDNAGVRYESSGHVQTRQNLTFKDKKFGKLKFIRFSNFSPGGPYYLSHVNAVARGN